MPSGKKKKRHKMSTHKRKKRLRKNRHKSKKIICSLSVTTNKEQTLQKQQKSFGFVLCLMRKVNNLRIQK